MHIRLPLRADLRIAAGPATARLPSGRTAHASGHRSIAVAVLWYSGETPRVDAPMRSRLALTVAFFLLATAAFAQSRPSTLRMTCAQAQGLVASRGSIVLSTGPYTFNRL
jgi:hypothetical protein